MHNRNWLKSNIQQRQLFAGWTTFWTRRIKPLIGLFACAVIWMALGLSLTGCATQSPATCPDQVMPPVPKLSEPLPQSSYSLKVQKLLQSWQDRLIDMPMMQKP